MCNGPVGTKRLWRYLYNQGGVFSCCVKEDVRVFPSDCQSKSRYLTAHSPVSFSRQTYDYSQLTYQPTTGRFINQQLNQATNQATHQSAETTRKHSSLEFDPFGWIVDLRITCAPDRPAIVANHLSKQCHSRAWSCEVTGASEAQHPYTEKRSHQSRIWMLHVRESIGHA